MTNKKLTAEEVLEIFSDYLEQTEMIEIVYTSKMGALLVFDDSSEIDRSILSAEKIKDSDELINRLLWSEMSELYYSASPKGVEPSDCYEEIYNYIWVLIQPRLNRLSPKWGQLVTSFFSDPEGNEDMS